MSIFRFQTLVKQPQFNAVTGEVKLCAKPAVVEHKKFAASQQQTGNKEEKKDKKKEEEPVEEADAAELALAAEPKSKDPFDFMPKG